MLDAQRFATSGIPTFDISPFVDKAFRAALSLTSEAQPEENVKRGDWGIARIADWANALTIAYNPAQAGNNPFPRGAALSRTFVYPAVVFDPPPGRFAQNNQIHHLKVIRDKDGTDADFAIVENASPVYSGAHKLLKGVPALVVRGTGHSDGSRKPLIYPQNLLVAQHEGIDVPDYSTFVHDGLTDGGATAISAAQRAHLSTVFRVSDVPINIPLDLSQSAYASVFRKIVALNFAKPNYPGGGAHGAAIFNPNGISTLALLGASGFGPLCPSSRFEHIIEQINPSGHIVTMGAVQTWMLHNYNNYPSPHFGQTGPLAIWRPDIPWDVKKQGQNQTPVEAVWDQNYKYNLGGRIIKGGWRLVAWGEFETLTEPGAGYIPPTGGGSIGVPGGSGSGGGVPGGSGNGGGNSGGGGNGGPGGNNGGPGYPDEDGDGVPDAIDPINDPNDVDNDGKPDDDEDDDKEDNKEDADKESPNKSKNKNKSKSSKRKTIKEKELQRAKNHLARAKKKRRYPRPKSVAIWEKAIARIQKEIDDAKAREEARKARAAKAIRYFQSGGDGGAAGGGNGSHGSSSPSWSRLLGSSRRFKKQDRREDKEGSSGGSGDSSQVASMVQADARPGSGSASVVDIDGVGAGAESSVATRKQLESPCQYFHPAPGAPDVIDIPLFPGQGDGTQSPGANSSSDGDSGEGGAGGDAGSGSLGGPSPQDTNGLKRYVDGFDDRQWHLHSPIVATEQSAAVYDTSAQNLLSGDIAERWPAIFARVPWIDSEGNRRAGFGDGSVSLMPGNLHRKHQFIENASTLPTTIPSLTRIIAAMGDGAGNAKIDGAWGLGMRSAASNEIVSGWQLSLNFSKNNASDNSDSPHIEVESKDENGVTSKLGNFRIHGLTSLGQYEAPEEAALDPDQGSLKWDLDRLTVDVFGLDDQWYALATEDFVSAATAAAIAGLGALAFLNTVGPAQIDNLAVQTGKIIDNGVTDAKLRNSAGLSVIGRSVNSTGDPADIAGTSDQVLRVNSAGNSLDFGQINLASASAVTGTTAVANGGTGAATVDAALTSLVNAATARTPILTSKIAGYLASAAAGGSFTAQSILTLMASLGDMGTIAPTTDHVMVDDGGTPVKMDVDDFLGNSIAQVAATSLAIDDEIGFCDVSVSDTLKNQRLDLLLAPERKFKNADQTYTADTSLNNDNDLQVTLVASGQYQIELFLNITSGATPDFEFDFNGGTATFTDFKIAWHQHDNGNSGAATSAATVHTIAAAAWPKYVKVCIGCTVNAGGTFIVRHAQNASDAVATGLLRGSWMETRRVA